MNGTTNVDQTNEFEFRLLEFMDKERKLTVEQSQRRDYGIKIRKYLEENGVREIAVYPNKKQEKGKEKQEQGR